MGMFDEVRAINISHANFDKKHNNLTFQTKDLECELFEYCVFNNDLYVQAEYGEDGYVRHNKAIKSKQSGTVNIYTDFTRNKIEYWVEYDLVFENGELVDVITYDERIRKDHRDISGSRPNKPSNRVIIEINVSNCDDTKKEAVIAQLTDEKIAGFRDLIEDPLATVSYPAKRTPNNSEYGILGLGSTSLYGNIMSVVQSMDDLKRNENSNKATLKAPNGDVIIILDEFNNY